MKSDHWRYRLDKFSRRLNQAFEWIGVLGLLSMFVVNFIDVVGAKIFLRPFPGAVELIGFSQIIAIAPAIGFGLILGRHIRVEFIMTKFPKRLRATTSMITSFLCFITFALLLWQSVLYGQSLQKSGEIGSTSYIPFYPFAYFIAFCCIPICLAFLVEILQNLAEAGKNGPS